MRIITELIVRMALENPRWGYTRIRGALYNLGHEVGRGTIANVLKRESIEPAPERGGGTPWSVFLEAHWRSIVAADFFTAEVWSLHGLVTYYVLLLIELAERIVHIVGITTRPNEAWMLQVGRNLTDVVAGTLTAESHLILDRDANPKSSLRAMQPLDNRGSGVPVWRSGWQSDHGRPGLCNQAPELSTACAKRWGAYCAPVCHEGVLQGEANSRHGHVVHPCRPYVSGTRGLWCRANLPQRRGCHQ
jgi:hypothetical protein